jgi:hypothetical protein
MLRRFLNRNRWYERVGALPTSNTHGLVVMVAASGVASDVAVRYNSLGGEGGYLVTLGCANKQLLDQFCQDLDAVDIGLEWGGPIRARPQARRVDAADELAAATRGLAETATAHAAGREPSSASLVVITERLGHAAATVRPPTPASQRARDALAAAYERITAEPAPF